MGYQVVEIDGASFTADGRLKVAQDPPAAPPATTPVDIGGIANVSSAGAGISDTVYVIGAGKTLVVQNINGGAAVKGDGSKVELFYDPNGNGTGMTLVRAAYVDGSSFSIDMSREFGPGNGTRAMRLRRTNLGGATREVAAFLTGYEKT